ncbi:MAG TPA: hypothetical protein VF053_00020 [Streptosporangiales bacterium]
MPGREDIMVAMVSNYSAAARRAEPGRRSPAGGAVLAGFDTISGLASELVPGHVQTTLAAVGMSLQQVQARRVATRQAADRSTARATAAARGATGAANRRDRDRMPTPDARARQPRGR